VLSASTETRSIGLSTKNIDESNDSELDLASVNLYTNVADSSMNQVELKICKSKKANRLNAMLKTLNNQRANLLTSVVKKMINKPAVANLPLTDRSVCLDDRRRHFESAPARAVTRSISRQGVSPEQSLHSQKNTAVLSRSEKCGTDIVEDFTYFNDSSEGTLFASADFF